ncbi:unnamed protein product, partial [Prorocentrum cordatum]
RGLAAFCPAGRAWPAGPRARPPRRTGACGRHASFGRPGPLPLMANNVIDVAIRGVGGSSSSSSGKVAVKLDPSNVAPQAESRIAKLEKVNNVWGSCAGSGSDAFPRYRR